MAYSQYLQDKISSYLDERKVVFEEKKMFGGLAFMVRDKMCCGIIKEEMMARVGPDHFEKALSMEGCREMDFTGRSMKGYIYASAEACENTEIFEEIINMSLDYNPTAPSSKKRNK